MTDAEISHDSFERYLEHVPAAFAVTRGAQHTLVFANAAFRRLTVAAAVAPLGGPITAAFDARDTNALTELLDGVSRSGVVARDYCIDPVDGSTPAWGFTVWPALNPDGEAEHLVVELRMATRVEHTLARQREVVERLLLSALREHDAADILEASRQSATFLADESRRLGASLDENATLAAIASLSLPSMGAWCIVDILDDGNAMRRLAIVHPDPAKLGLVRELESRWFPERDDSFGVPAMVLRAESKVVADGLDEERYGPSRDPETLRILQALGVGPALTVPLIIRERLVGAVTFVGTPGRPFTPQEVALGEELATRSAMALDRARLYGEAVALKRQAESANEAKSAFLGSISHELRTPLHAIGGYVELIEMGLHGPVTEQQRADLTRIRASQIHLAGLIEDLLNFTKLGSGQVSYDISDVVVRDALAASVALVEPLISQKELVFDGIACDSAIVARADMEKLNQILVNLLSNAIKFTAPGGRITIDCESTERTVLIRVSDTGRGIPPDKLEAVFDPFVQVKSGLAGLDRGVGLGLSISRGLARAMAGDLTAESTLGKGTRFTLTLPRANSGGDKAR